ncbi:RNA polymerase sigma factor [Vreelandella alkaliphila]|uniref:RNA polymerase sigma factor n=1 Tax=Vreelandella alkaliphila TaxID=272774 RepID=UPI003F982CC4
MTHTPLNFLAQAAEAHYDELKQFVRRRTGSMAIAEDVVQETWIRAHSLAEEQPNNPRAYLYRMAGNLAIDHIRRERGRGIGLEDGGESPLSEKKPLESQPSPEPSPLDNAISEQELAALNAAVSELPSKCRDVFILYRGNGLTMREISSRLGVSQKTVEKHIARAMVHCRKRLREAGRTV